MKEARATNLCPAGARLAARNHRLLSRPRARQLPALSGARSQDSATENEAHGGKWLLRLRLDQRVARTPSRAQRFGGQLLYSNAAPPLPAALSSAGKEVQAGGCEWPGALTKAVYIAFHLTIAIRSTQQSLGLPGNNLSVDLRGGRGGVGSALGPPPLAFRKTLGWRHRKRQATSPACRASPDLSDQFCVQGAASHS